MSHHPNRRNRITEQFATRPIAMLESMGFRVLSRAAHMVLTRIEIESAHHGGKENGRLPITYDDFEKYGIHRHGIRPAISELEAFGLIEITERGRAGNAEFRNPNFFRLTYRHAKGEAGDGTHEWRRLVDITTAEAEAMAAPVTRQARAIEGRSARGQVTGKLRRAIEAMVWEGSCRPDAATAAGLQDHSVREALRKPHVKAFYRAQLDVLRTNERARNIHALIRVRDQARNLTAAVAAVKALEQLKDDAAPAGTGQATAPGLVIQIIGNGAIRPPTIEG